MPSDDWIDDDVEIARIALDRAIRTCPGCRMVWDAEPSSERFWHTPIRCPRCGTESVRDRRWRALWFQSPLRRIVTSGGEGRE